MLKGLDKFFYLAAFGLIILSFGIWSATWLGLTWIVSFIFKLNVVSYMTVFMISSIIWVLIYGVKFFFVYIGKKAADKFLD